MWYKVALSLVLKALPVERVVAWLLTKLLNKYLREPDNVEKYDLYVRTATRINEQTAVLLSALEDREVTTDEVTRAGADLLGRWADGKPKDAELEEKALRVTSAE